MRLKLQALEPFVINYVADTALIYWLDKDDATAIRMLDEFRPSRTAEIAQIHAAMGKHKEAASLLREMTAANYLPGVLDGAASLLDNAPSKTTSPESLPRLGNLSFVYLHAGAPERVFEFYEAALQAGYFQPISTTWLWHEFYAPVRKTERFKKLHPRYRPRGILPCARLAGPLPADQCAGFRLRLAGAPHRRCAESL